MADDIDVPGLASLDHDAAERVIEAGRLVHVPQGWTPIRAHEPADQAYLLLEGAVEVVSGDEVVATLGRGSFVGEMGLVDRSLRSARVTVVEPVLALAWPRADFQRLREELGGFDDLVRSVTAQRHEENEHRRES